MFGRGIDQIFPHPGDPRLYEVSIRDARDMSRLPSARMGRSRGGLTRPMFGAMPSLP